MSDESVQPHIGGLGATARQPQPRAMRVNGRTVGVSIEPGARLLDILRGPLGLTGSKEACGRGECGACTVLVDDRPLVSCLVYAETVSGDVVTIEGLSDANEDLRQAFADHGAFQCGFCTPGQVVRAVALLNEPWPAGIAEQERFVRHGMSGNLCRCTGYTGIVEAVVATKAKRSHAVSPTAALPPGATRPAALPPGATRPAALPPGATRPAALPLGALSPDDALRVAGA